MTIGLENPGRRGLMLGAAAAAVTVGTGAFAKAPMLKSQAPYFYRFMLGDAEATIVSDGTLPLGDPHTNFLGLSAAEMDEQLTRNFLPLSNAVLEQNILVLNTGSRVVLFDTGMGSLKLFGPTTGKLMTTLRQSGIKPEDIDAVVMSHAHVDHCGGCVGDDGKPNFPNAQFYISQADFDYWTDPAKVPQPMGAFLDTARKNLLPVRDRLVFFKDGEEFLPGIQALAAPGHTIGHTIFMITSGRQNLCYLGDLTHHPVLLMEKPLTEFAYDSDPKQSAQSRLRMLTMLAQNRIPVLAYHFAWPGIGHVAKNGDGFRYVPEPMKMEL
ncbi:MBL fold metallo-hydrolase [uncultured Methylobacterium sp.]|jgi:glyoxylase-like metal-dependent hydrolase (beta-lactamase superfamily II)|uniref:MBL fold metallo-hydrolase n=1 Tax=uncultured Methylobacterium sp. TaxID=157278 RepID=UPI002639329B|nr:MBL fold metallo-hydrolase [uncultured Methylobacterium sp.]